MKRTVFFLSDSTGITAETLGLALLTQFDDLDFNPVTLPFITDATEAAGAVERINVAADTDGIRPIVFSTLADAGINEAVTRSNALVLDLFSVFLRPLELEFDLGSSHALGRLHGLVNRASYEVRIEAVDFALAHDDGERTKHYDEADIILVGVSRSGKTPTCLYLAMQFGLRAANYPITEEVLSGTGLPKVLNAYRKKLFGLTIDPDRLHEIRSERRPNSQYASLPQCRKEVSEVTAMYAAVGLSHLDTSRVSIEEIASRILKETGLKRRSG